MIKILSPSSIETLPAKFILWGAGEVLAHFNSHFLFFYHPFKKDFINSNENLNLRFQT